MRILAAGTIIGALLGGAANAQDSTTTCYRLGMNVRCDTHTPATIQPPAPIDLTPLLRQQQQSQQQLANTLAELEARRQEEARLRQQEALLKQQEALLNQQRDTAAVQAFHENYNREIRIRVGQFLQKGDCEAAEALALSIVDIELANRAKAYCAKP